MSSTNSKGRAVSRLRSVRRPRLASAAPNSRAVTTTESTSKSLIRSAHKETFGRALRANTLLDVIRRFRKTVWAHYREYGRHDLPWRKTRDLYRILVSEVMLQQTQVERVIPFYERFIMAFPTEKSLAAAPLSEVLIAWQGLGYNRRAKLLREAAQRLVHTPLSGTRLNLVKGLEALPGVGSYTARAVAAFAWNADVIVIETNIRTAIIQSFFPKKKKVSDADIEKVLAQVLPKGRAREWYSALMDYGAHLKRSGVSHNARSATHTKQTRFAGSLREARGAVLRELSMGAASRARLLGMLGVDRKEQVLAALRDLGAEGLVRQEQGRYALPN